MASVNGLTLAPVPSFVAVLSTSEYVGLKSQHPYYCSCALINCSKSGTIPSRFHCVTMFAETLGLYWSSSFGSSTFHDSVLQCKLEVSWKWPCYMLKLLVKPVSYRFKKHFYEKVSPYKHGLMLTFHCTHQYYFVHRKFSRTSIIQEIKYWCP